MECCELARSRDPPIEYVWIDTCCIDKRDSAELAESINSMYTWYGNAQECYAYLADVGVTISRNGKTLPAKTLDQSDWFTRGWTLQELLAPQRVDFYNAEWQHIGDKLELLPVISQRTGIARAYLRNPADIYRASVAQKMSWAAGRRTRKKEDRAYSLLGLFGINMPPLYGEGNKAFLRLQQEIVRSINDESLFAWISNKSFSGMLADSPDNFAHAGDIVKIDLGAQQRPPYTFGNKGLEFQVFQRQPTLNWNHAKFFAQILYGDPETSVKLGCYKGRPDQVVTIELVKQGHSWKRRNCQAYYFKSYFRDPTPTSTIFGKCDVQYTYYVTQ